MKKIFVLILLVSISCFKTCLALDRAIAITIDDLPFVGDEANFHLNLIIDCIQKNHIPVTGFVIADRVTATNLPTLQRFSDTAHSLGNHTLTHLSLNQVDANTYIQNVDQADRILTPVLTKPRYFRYPYLAMGQGRKREEVLQYLASKNYHVAPITIDSKDFIFNQQLLAKPEIDRRAFLKELLPVYLDYILIQTRDAEEYNHRNHLENRTQILLIHANLLNAYVLDNIIDLYRNLGYHFVSLRKALKTFPTQKENIASGTTENQNTLPLENTRDPDTQIEEFMDWDNI